MIWYGRFCSNNKAKFSFLNQSNYFPKILVWNLGGNAENARNQGGDVENQGGNLGIAVKMKKDSGGIDKFKERREVKIIEL